MDIVMTSGKGREGVSNLDSTANLWLESVLLNGSSFQKGQRMMSQLLVAALIILYRQA